MAENEEKKAKATESSEAESSTEEKKSLNLKGYERLINRMEEQRKELQKDLSKNYQETRHYVREHPEEGVLYAFVGGLAIGLLLGTSFSGGSRQSGE